MSTGAVSRSLHVDALRGFAMTCVVLGHAIQRNVGPTEPLFLVLAAFEMPLFAFVSGYLTRLAPDAGPGATALTRARRLLVPFIVWAPIMWVMSHFAWSGLDVVGIPGSLTQYLVQLFAQPRTGLWYLLVLFYWWVIVLLARVVFRRVNLLTLVLAGFATLVALALARHLGQALLGGDFGLKALADLLPFFIAGWAVRKHARPLDARLPNAAALAGVSLLGLMVASVVMEPTLFAPVREFSAAVGAQALRLYHYAQAALGVGAAVLLLRSRVFDGALAPFALAGRSSMGIYAIHLMFLRTGFGDEWVMAISSFAVAMAVSLIGTWLLRKSPLAAEAFLGEPRPRVKVEPAAVAG